MARAGGNALRSVVTGVIKDVKTGVTASITQLPVSRPIPAIF